MEDCLLEIGSKGNKELAFATMPSNSHHVTLHKNTYTDLLIRFLHQVLTKDNGYNDSEKTICP
jgi:hypothetical protein